MSDQKRRDSRGRVLRLGESQRKDGRYAYKYRDANGKFKFVYAWKLGEKDRTPSGKREGLSLREKEKEIQKALDAGLDISGGRLTVCELYEKKNRQRKNVKLNTRKGQLRLLELLKEDPLGGCMIDSIRLSDGREWAIRMSEKGYAYKTIDNYKRSLKAAFYMAIQDDCIRRNPFDFKLSDVLENDTEAKTGLSPEQEEKMLNFMKEDETYRKYYDEVVILLETGLRISEFCGLTEDVDMENRIITVDHQLMKDARIGYYIETPKTKNGIRQLPMTNKTYEAFKSVLANKKAAAPLEVSGYSNFLFLNAKGLPKVAGDYKSMLLALVKKYNKNNEDQLPHITPHLLRHTYCTKMANMGMNPNTLQYLMGHANVNMTLGYYAHGSFQSARAELDRLNS